MIEEILEKLDQLPPVPDILQELQQMYYLDAYNAKDIEETIKKDPNLVANILKVVNSPYYGFPREIYEIRQAIVMFGLDQIIEFAFASMVEGFIQYDLEFYGMDAYAFMKLSQLKARISKTLIENKKKSFLVSNTAFLSDVSKVIISNYAKEKGLAPLECKELSLNEIDEIEKEILGFDTINISLKMFENWNFDEKMIELLRDFKNRQTPEQKALFVSRDIVTPLAKIDMERAGEYREILKPFL